MGYEQMNGSARKGDSAGLAAAGLEEKVGGIPEWACHAFGIVTACGVVVCLVVGTIMVRVITPFVSMRCFGPTQDLGGRRPWFVQHPPGKRGLPSTQTIRRFSKSVRSFSDVPQLPDW